MNITKKKQTHREQTSSYQWREREVGGHKTGVGIVRDTNYYIQNV